MRYPLFLLVIVILSIGGAIASVSQRSTPEAPDFASMPAPARDVILSIADIYSGTLPHADGVTALSLLQKAAREHDIAVETKTYAGMGTLVQAIGPHAGGEDGKYWMLYVNGTFSLVGADAYVVAPGDVVEWRFETPEEF